MVNVRQGSKYASYQVLVRPELSRKNKVHDRNTRVPLF